MDKALSDHDRKQIASIIANGGKTAVGNRMGGMDSTIDMLSKFNDAATVAELVPSLGSYLSGAAASSVLSASSFIGVLLFPLQQSISLINANETGLKFYSYRSIAYTITAWSFDHAIPTSSPRRIANLNSGPYRATKSIQEYNKAWSEASVKTLSSIESACNQRGVPKAHMKLIFRALGDNQPGILSVQILQTFEKELSSITRNIWRSSYKVYYPN